MYTAVDSRTVLYSIPEYGSRVLSLSARAEGESPAAESIQAPSSPFAVSSSPYLPWQLSRKRRRRVSAPTTITKPQSYRRPVFSMNLQLAQENAGRCSLASCTYCTLARILEPRRPPRCFLEPPSCSNTRTCVTDCGIYRPAYLTFTILSPECLASDDLPVHQRTGSFCRGRHHGHKQYHERYAAEFGGHISSQRNSGAVSHHRCMFNVYFVYLCSFFLST
jgi:hypothetical protein